jgi:hypothetical protein
VLFKPKGLYEHPKADLINPNRVQSFPFQKKGEATAEGNTMPKVVMEKQSFCHFDRSRPFKNNKRRLEDWNAFHS